MKQSVFTTALIIISIVVSAVIFYFVFGNPANFTNPERTVPSNLMGAIFLGGPIVVLLMALSIMVITFTIERQLSLSKAKGRGCNFISSCPPTLNSHFCLANEAQLHDWPRPFLT